MPDRLSTAKGTSVEPVHVQAAEQRIDFASVFAGFGERRPVVGFAYLDSPGDVELPAAASSDWWMAWYVNGEQVYSTLDTGNRHGTLANHTFTLPLKKGRNVIAFQCLSGSGGWSIRFGGPRERYLAVTGGEPLDRLCITLLDDADQPMAERVLPLDLRAPLPRLGEGHDPDAPAAWLPLEPVAVLGADTVANRFVEQPDSDRWYKGEADLSAVVWLREHAGKLHLFVQVRDDEHQPPTDTIGPDEADGVHVVFADVDGAVRIDRKLTATERAGDRTLYRFALPTDALPERVFRMSLSIQDRDGGVLKQHLDLGQVAAPANGMLLHQAAHE